MAFAEEPGGGVEGEPERAVAGDFFGNARAAAEEMNAAPDEGCEEDRENDRRDGGGPGDPVWPETAVVPVSIPADGEHDEGPEEPAGEGEERGTRGDAGGFAAQDVDPRGDDERVGHDEPNGDDELEMEIRDDHLSGVDEAEDDEADARNIFARGVEEQDRAGDGESEKDGGDAEGCRAEDGHAEGEDDERDCAIERDAAGRNGAIGIEGLVATPVQDIVERGGEAEETERVDEAAEEEDPEREIAEGLCAGLVRGGVGPKDDEPDVGDGREGGGDAREVKGGEDLEDEAAHRAGGW